MHQKFLRLPAVQELTALSKSTLWRLTRKGLFPQRRQLSANAVGWLQSEIETWMSNRAIAGVAT